MKIRLNKAAIRDLREARNYIAADDPKAAAGVVARLESAIELIAERPHIGRPHSQESVREWSVTGLPYLIPYRQGDGYVEIIRIHHTSRRRPARWI